MRAVEALERLLASADREINSRLIQQEVGSDLPQELQDDMAAQAICQAMVNTAIPIARFRVHAEVKSPDARKTKVGECDFTVCGTTIQSVKAGIIALLKEDAQLYVTLWEQSAAGAEMLSGFQGASWSQPFRNWIKQLDHFQTDPTIQ